MNKYKSNPKFNSIDNDYCFRDKRFEINKAKNSIENQLIHLNYDRNYLNIVDKTKFLSVNHFHDSNQSNDDVTNLIEKNDFFMNGESRNNLIKFKNDYSSFN